MINVTRIKIFDSGNQVAFLTNNKIMSIYNLKDHGNPQKQFQQELNSSDFTISKDNKKLISIYENRIEIWEIDSTSLVNIYSDETSV